MLKVIIHANLANPVDLLEMNSIEILMQIWKKICMRIVTALLPE